VQFDWFLWAVSVCTTPVVAYSGRCFLPTTSHKHLDSVIENVKTDPRGFYRFIKSKRTDSSDVPTLKSDGKIIVSGLDEAQCLNNYFVSTFKVENLGPFQAKVNLFPDMPDILVTEPGVLKLLSSLDTKKSMGPDNLSPLILKEVSYEITGILSFIFNQSLSSGQVPEDWRLAYVFTLHKKGVKDMPENYRPVSLTSICSKIL
jgi:hypothetical protein